MPPDARFFEDILDGYVPLRISLRQCFARNGMDAAFLVITQAPVLHLPGRAPDAPVPLRLGDEVSGLIRRLAVITSHSSTSGLGEWRWQDGARRALSEDDRLAEPAFVRGLGWCRMAARTGEDTGHTTQVKTCWTVAGQDWGLSAPPGLSPLSKGTVHLATPRHLPSDGTPLPPIARALIEDWHL
ncbi:hypothetical protein [uncultured Maritimibacter sp.]|jgi:hypothetical protein|uniref:hypothetical protein n=1 Tax=uncultured Maritimibacter sp. TaxID=991866 RepID=UPI002614F55C|nr:hypothetical protein [uncultured Maritimibacter sp.]